MEWAIRRQEPPGEGSEVGRALPHEAPASAPQTAAPCQAAESALIVT